MVICDPLFLKKYSRGLGGIEVVIPGNDIEAMIESLLTSSSDSSNELEQMTCPVIRIVGLGQDCGKLEAHLRLQSYFQDHGFRVASIASRSDFRIDGVMGFPWAIFASHASDEVQVVLFNHFLAAVVKDQSPDVLILTVPGGLCLTTRGIRAQFGVLHYKIADAVRPDVVICSLYHGEYSAQGMSLMSGAAARRMGRPIDFFLLTENLIDPIL